jgi:hypothetical protein
MLRALGIRLAMVSVVAFTSAQAHAGEWILHRTDLEHLEGGDAATVLEGFEDGYYTEAAGYDSELGQYFAQATDAKWNTTTLEDTYANGEGYVGFGLDDVAITGCHATGGCFLSINSGSAAASGSASGATDWVVTSSGSPPSATYSLTFVVDVSAVIATTGIANNLLPGGGVGAYAWIGDFNDAVASGQIVAAGVNVMSGESWYYDPENGYVEGSSQTTYTFTGLDGTTPDVHFWAAGDVTFEASEPSGTFTAEGTFGADCAVTIAAE